LKLLHAPIHLSNIVRPVFMSTPFLRSNSSRLFSIWWPPMTTARNYGTVYTTIVPTTISTKAKHSICGTTFCVALRLVNVQFFPSANLDHD